jgi:hypothetical protein
MAQVEHWTAHKGKDGLVLSFHSLNMNGWQGGRAPPVGFSVPESCKQEGPRSLPTGNRFLFEGKGTKATISKG